MSKSNSWVINPTQDGIWFIGSATAGFVLLFAYYGLTRIIGLQEMVAAGALYILWAISLDASHVFAMYSRTYFDREFLRERKALALNSLLLFIVGPVLVLGYYYFLGGEAVRAFSLVFSYFGLTYAYYHLSRQHWGILVLYNKKAGEHSISDARRDAAMLGIGVIYPFCYGMAVERSETHQMSLAETFPLQYEIWGSIVLSFGIVAVVAFFLAIIFSHVSRELLFLGTRNQEVASFMTRVGCIFAVVAVVVKVLSIYGVPETLGTVSNILRIGFAVTTLWYLTSVYKKYKTNPDATFSKEIFLAVVLLTHNVILHQQLPLLMFVICLTIFHNLQYHRIVRYYNVNKYTGDDARSKHGIAAFFTSRFEGFVLAAFTFSLLYLIPKTSNEIFNVNELSNYILMTFFWGFAFHHYYLDSIIWKAKRVKNLNKDLKI